MKSVIEIQHILTSLSRGTKLFIVTIHGCRKPTANGRAEYGPHWDTLSLREARSGSNAANYAAKEPAGFKGSL